MFGGRRGRVENWRMGRWKEGVAAGRTGLLRGADADGAAPLLQQQRVQADAALQSLSRGGTTAPERGRPEGGGCTGPEPGESAGFVFAVGPGVWESAWSRPRTPHAPPRPELPGDLDPPHPPAHSLARSALCDGADKQNRPTAEEADVRSGSRHTADDWFQVGVGTDSPGD